MEVKNINTSGSGYSYGYQTWRKAPAFRYGDISHTFET